MVPTPTPDTRHPRLAIPRWLHYLLLAGVMTWLAYALHGQQWIVMEALDNRVLDIAYRYRTPHAPAEVATSLPATRDIVMVELPHPISRHLLAQLVTRLRLAKAVALDVMLVDEDAELNARERPWFAEDLQRQQQQTAELARAIRAAGNVIVGVWADESLPAAGARREIWRFPEPACWQAARYHAHLFFPPDALDHIVRRVPLFSDIAPQQPGEAGAAHHERLPCLGLALAAAAENVSPAQLRRLLADLPARGGEVALGTRRIAYERQGAMTIDFVGDHTCFEDDGNRVVYYRALDQYLSPADFADKLVIIGSADLNSKDVSPTPYGMMSGMQLHANVVATLRGAQAQNLRVPPWLLIGLGFCCSALLIVPLLRWPLWSSLLIAAGEMVLVVTLLIETFERAHLEMAASVPLLAMVFSLLAIVVYEYGRVLFTLEKFVGPEMVKRALYRFAHLRLGSGSVEQASAMFCDLRGFSTLAESLPPATIADLLNDYTEVVVTVSRRFHGRPIDFAGDGVFVLFEASLTGRRHSLQAVRAALALRQAFGAFRARWHAQGIPGLAMGVAIHTGSMMIGLLGSEHFLKLGAVGDVVNVAARVQGLSTECGYDVLITEETYAQIQPEITADNCGAFAIRGRTQPVTVYGLAETARREGNIA